MTSSELGRRTEVRHLPPRVAIVRRFDHVVLEVRAEAVLRPEQRRQRHLRVVPETICGVPELRVDRRRIAHETDAASRHQGAFGVEELVYAKRDDSRSGAGEGRHGGIIDLPLEDGSGASSDGTVPPHGALRRSC